jgi:signal transduction histidine kinase
MRLYLSPRAHTPRRFPFRGTTLGIADLQIVEESVTGEDTSKPTLEPHQLERVLQVGRSLVAELDLETVLGQVLEAARDLTGARYAALGILDVQKTGLEQFLVNGLDAETRRTIGDLPQGRGVLGELITNPHPLRLANVGEHPRSYGFPPGHPPMTSFLGTPIRIRDEVWGNLYLTDKAGGEEFTENDQELAVVLSDWAAIGIANARLYSGLQDRHAESERAVRALEASAAVARAVGGEVELDRVLELIVKRGRALLDARVMVLLVPSGDGLVVSSAAGDHATELIGARVPLDSLPGQVLSSIRTQSVSDINSRVRHGLGDLNLEASIAVLSPLVYRAQPQGVLMALDRVGTDNAFDRDDQQLLESFAASAATAIATAQSVETEKLQLTIEASEQERRRWARELHDETLQELGGLKVMLETAQNAEDTGLLDKALTRAISQVDQAIQDLQGLITELRPAALDELGTAAALEDLITRVQATSGLTINFEASLAYEQGIVPTRHTPELESAIYRTVQEALNNATKHSGASQVQIRVKEDSDQIRIEISDDGDGFDPSARSPGFGLLGMRERVRLNEGELEIESAPGQGTRIRARMRVIRAPESSSSDVHHLRAG